MEIWDLWQVPKVQNLNWIAEKAILSFIQVISGTLPQKGPSNYVFVKTYLELAYDGKQARDKLPLHLRQKSNLGVWLFFFFYRSYTTQGSIWPKMDAKYQLFKSNAKIHSINHGIWQKYQIERSQNGREVTNLHRKCKNQKTKKISRSRIHIRKNWFSSKCKILRHFGHLLLHVLKTVFFRKILNPLSDTKVDHYNYYEGDYWVDGQMVLSEYISDIRDRRPRVLFPDKKKEMNADAPKWRKWRTDWAQTVFLLVSPK